MTCDTCGNGISIARSDARFCSTACRMKDYRKRKKASAETIPAELRESPRWMRWEKLNRKGKTSKRPVAVSGLPGSSTNPDRWCDYRSAKASSIGHGVGFALGKGIGCIDLDGALDESGNPLPWAQRIIDATPATFIEVSQSGLGLHIFGHLSEGPGSNKGNGVEVYSAGRFIAITGQRFNDAPSVLADISELAAQIT